MADTQSSMQNLTEDQLAAMKALQDYSNLHLIVLNVMMMVSYAIMWVLSSVLLGYMRHNRAVARRGDVEAARKILLPSFEPLLWIMCCATAGFTIFCMFALIFHHYADNVLSIDIFYAGRQFVQLLVVIFMLQHSVSIPALKRTIAVTLLLSCYSVPVAWYISLHTNSNSSSYNTTDYWSMMATHGLLVLVYVYVAVRPPSRATKQTLREYCGFAFIYNALEFAYATAFTHNHIKWGFALIYMMLIWGSLCPFFIWRILKADTEHWRGMGQRACALQHLLRQKTNVNEHISSEGLHVLIEMHRKYIIDFAYLELKQRIGVGSSAKVYEGVLHSKTPVAVKVYTPTSVTEDTVAEFSHEAALCGALNHPNIVKFFGMCVSPPTICLVSELCYASLDVVITAAATKHQPSRQQFLVNLGYMLDAARAVAYIHSFSPAFVHRDIKPANFLVDMEGTVKLTDFGESRTLPKVRIEWGMAPHDYTSTTKKEDVYDNAEHYLELSSHGTVVSTPPSQQPTNKKHLEMTVKGTADYMAPEIINGKAGVASYGEAADVYSLAITMWDILNPGVEKYPNSNSNRFQIFESVLAGDRPTIDGSLNSSLCELLRSAWHINPRQRPTAQTIVTALERIQEEAGAEFAKELSQELANDLVSHSGSKTTPKSFSGERAVRKMEQLKAVDFKREAIRLGNMLMDAGFLHHVKHAQCFTCSGTAMFLFDEDKIRLCQPFAMLEGAPSPFNTTPEWNSHENLGSSKRERQQRDISEVQPNKKSGAATVEISTSNSSNYENYNSESGCACQRLGRRLETRKTAKRRFRRKYKAIPEENVLTVNLLQQDDQSTTPNRNSWDDTPELSSPIVITTLF